MSTTQRGAEVQEAAMRLRVPRRGLVVWSSSACQAAPGTFIHLRRTGRFRRLVRTGKVIALIGLLRLARVVRPRWQPLLAGTVLTVTGVMLRGNSWGAILLPGLLLLAYSLFIPAGTDEDHRQLERELASYSTHAQRCDLEATLDRYPDSLTHELREILSGQATRS